MYRKIFIASLLGLGLLTPLALTSSAQAYVYYRRPAVVVRPGPVYPAYGVSRPAVVGVGVYPSVAVYPRYQVMYRYGPAQPWVVTGSYPSLHNAEFAAQGFRARGFQVSVRGY
jgi:hypothetical protein